MAIDKKLVRDAIPLEAPISSKGAVLFKDTAVRGRTSSRRAAVMGVLAIELAFGVGWSASQAHAGLCVDHFRASRPVTQDSAVELEMNLTVHVMNLLTTTDGTLAPFFMARDLKLSDALTGVLKAEYLKQVQSRWVAPIPSGQSFSVQYIRTLRFDPLSFQVKRELLQALVKDQEFGSSASGDRQIEGLVPRETIDLYFDRPTRFLGREYPEGIHTISTRGFLTSEVHLVSPKERENLQMVELHIRSQRPASELSLDARTLQKGILETPTHQHAHVVAPHPTRFLERDPIIHSAVIADYVRRLNTAAEMYGIAHKDSLLVDNVQGTTQFFMSHVAQNYGQMMNYLFQVGRGTPQDLGSLTKMGWVGMWGHDKYDGGNVWGLEFRAIGRKDNPRDNANFLAGIQRAVNESDWGVRPDQYSAWLRHRAETTTPTTWWIELGRRMGLSSLVPSKWKESYARRVREEGVRTHLTNYDWVEGNIVLSAHNRSFDSLLRTAHPELQPLLAGLKNNKPMREKLETYKALKMIVHNWHQDPILYTRPDLLPGILEAQKRALRELVRLEGKSLSPIMKRFLQDSRLLETFLDSVGVQIDPEMEAVTAAAQSSPRP